VGGRVCLLVLLLVAALPASAQAGDIHALTVTVDPPSRPQEPGSDQYVIGTRTPTFHVQADLSGAPPGYEVHCHVDMNPDGPCGTQDAQCPVSQCWTFTASHDSDGDGHVLTVSISSPDGTDDYDVGGVFYSIDTTPPDTKLVGISGPDLPLQFPDPRHVAFGFDRADDDSYDSTFQCAITSPSADSPASWTKCGSEGRLSQKLSLTSTYRFWVRAVDFLRRPDPTPVSYVFSPTPCHLKVLAHPHRLRAIAQHGLKLRMSCVNPVPFEVALLLNTAQTIKLGLPSSALGVADSQTTTPQTSKTLTLHTYKGLPKTLFKQKKLFVGLAISTIGASPKVVELKLHR
jgi:hypothetical protein